MENLKKLVKAHKNYATAIKSFEDNSGLESSGHPKWLLLYGEESYRFLRSHGGIEHRNEITLKVDGIDVVCLRNV